jgi:nucleolar protein 56
MAMFLLFEAASGYGLMECVEAEEVASQSKKVLESVGDVSKFSKIVKLKAFQAFESAEDALQNINDVSEGVYCLLAALSGIGMHIGSKAVHR